MAFWLNCFYIVVLAWAMYYVYASLAWDDVPWRTCDKPWNTIYCKSEYVLSRLNQSLVNQLYFFLSSFFLSFFFLFFLLFFSFLLLPSLFPGMNWLPIIESVPSLQPSPRYNAMSIQLDWNHLWLSSGRIKSFKSPLVFMIQEMFVGPLPLPLALLGLLATFASGKVSNGLERFVLDFIFPAFPDF